MQRGLIPSQSLPRVLGRVGAGWAVLLSAPAASAGAGESAKTLSSEEASSDEIQRDKANCFSCSFWNGELVEL